MAARATSPARAARPARVARAARARATWYEARPGLLLGGGALAPGAAQDEAGVVARLVGVKVGQLVTQLVTPCLPAHHRMHSARVPLTMHIQRQCPSMFQRVAHTAKSATRSLRSHTQRQCRSMVQRLGRSDCTLSDSVARWVSDSAAHSAHSATVSLVGSATWSLTQHTQ